MVGPWEITPIPAQGDERSEDTHAAKGRAVSNWEEVEVALSGLYAVISGFRRSDVAARQRYGDIEQIAFKHRLAGLETLGEPYLRRRCDQEFDGEFERLMDMARQFSTRRNEITHSCVRPVAFSRTFQKTASGDQWTTRYRFFLVPPDYTSRKFDPNNRPKFIYTSAEINAYSDWFLRIGLDVDRLAILMENPRMRAYVDKPLSLWSGPNTDQHQADPSKSQPQHGSSLP